MWMKLIHCKWQSLLFVQCPFAHTVCMHRKVQLHTAQVYTHQFKKITWSCMYTAYMYEQMHIREYIGQSCRVHVHGRMPIAVGWHTGPDPHAVSYAVSVHNSVLCLPTQRETWARSQWYSTCNYRSSMASLPLPLSPLPLATAQIQDGVLLTESSCLPIPPAIMNNYKPAVWKHTALCQDTL